MKVEASTCETFIMWQDVVSEYSFFFFFFLHLPYAVNNSTLRLTCTIILTMTVAIFNGYFFGLEAQLKLLACVVTAVISILTQWHNIVLKQNWNCSHKVSDRTPNNSSVRGCLFINIYLFFNSTNNSIGQTGTTNVVVHAVLLSSDSLSQNLFSKNTQII